MSRCSITSAPTDHRNVRGPSRTSIYTWMEFLGAWHFRVEESLWEPIFLLDTGVFLNSLNKTSVNSSVNLFWFIGLHSPVLVYCLYFIRIGTFFVNHWKFVFFTNLSLFPLATTFLLFLSSSLKPLNSLMHSFIYRFHMKALQCSVCLWFISLA